MSLIQVVNDRVGIAQACRWAEVDVPDGSANRKTWCPFGITHPDGGTEASLRLYEDTNTAHCLAAETSVLTRDGYRPISELSGRVCRVVTAGPRGPFWTDALFKSYGVQRLYRVMMRRNGISREIYATDGHRWLVRKRAKPRDRCTEKTTVELRLGDRLRSSYLPKSQMTLPSPWGAAHGFAYGDGSFEAGPTSGVRVTLWGDKDAAMARFYPLSPLRPVSTPAGAAGVQVSGLPRFFKDRPSLEESAGYLYGWLAGYFAADGCVDSGGCPMLNSADRDDLEFVRLVCIRLGVTSYGITSQLRFGFGAEPSLVYKLTFARSTLTKPFFLLDEHRRRWAQHREVKERVGWVVESVESTDRVEEVYCAEVPETHNFVLEDSLVTGNCFACGKSWGPVALMAEYWDCDRAAAADKIARMAGVHEPTWRDRWEELHQPAVPDRDQLAEALKTWCRRVRGPSWDLEQLTPRFSVPLGACLALLPLVSSEQESETWLDGCKIAMTQVLRGEDVR